MRVCSWNVTYSEKTILGLIIRGQVLDKTVQRKCPTILYGVNLWLKAVSATGATNRWNLNLGSSRFLYANFLGNMQFFAAISRKCLLIGDLYRPTTVNYVAWRIKSIVPLDMKGCICHFTKWQIHLFICKGTIYTHICMVNECPCTHVYKSSVVLLLQLK